MPWPVLIPANGSAGSLSHDSYALWQLAPNVEWVRAPDAAMHLTKVVCANRSQVTTSGLGILSKKCYNLHDSGQKQGRVFLLLER